MTQQVMFVNLPHISTNNKFLDFLSRESFERLLRDLESVQLKRGEILYRAEEPIRYLYFPKTAMISVIANTINGQSAEVGIIGREGVAGIDVLMGNDRTPHQNIVQLPGIALRIRASAIQKEFKRFEELHDLTLQFMRLMTIQISRIALCNRLHSAEERLARGLLMCHDRVETDELKLTQEFLQIMLGEDRMTVTLSAITLQNKGFINYHRGDIMIIDRVGLEDFACECYEAIQSEKNNVFGKRQIPAKNFEKISREIL